MTLYWPPEKTFQYRFKGREELTMVIPLENNKDKKHENKKSGMEK